jgi:hypothetical protein
VRPAVLAFVAFGLSTLACASSDTGQCPGATVAVFRLKGPIVYKGDPEIAGLDPVPGLPDCTPDPFDSDAPIRYPHLLPPFDAKLAADPVTTAAALCRSNGIVYSGERSGASHYAVEADAGPAAPCTNSTNSLCAATMRVIMAGDVVLDPGGVPQGFEGILVEVLTQEAGACDACLPPVPDAVPPVLACAARYALTGTPR